MRSLVEGPMRKQRPAVYQSLLLEEEMGADPLVADIEERVARLSGIPAHADESPLRASLNRVWPPQRAVHSLSQASNLQNLHHDAAKGGERRVATALIYLSDADEGPDSERAAPSSHACSQPSTSPCSREERACKCMPVVPT